MKVLFISSGNSLQGISTIVFNQGESLKKHGISVDYFTIKGKGLVGYFKNIPTLKKFMKNNNYDTFHAHYSLCGYIAVLSGCKPLVISLMGSDTYMSFVFRLITKFFSFFFWKTVIVKTEKMKKLLNLKKAIIIPNGVDMERFKPIDKLKSREILNLPLDKKIILFASNPNRYEKNYTLAEAAVNNLNNPDVLLKTVYDIPNDLIPYYMNAADVLLLTSLWEGSVNVVKEAMACNCPIVSTEVGDVKYNLSNIAGCFITDFTPKNVAENIQKAIKFEKPTKGRNRIVEIGLDSGSIAKKIINLYSQLLK